MEDRLKLKEMTIKGFKSISSEGQTLEFGDITVLIGANGSGKSNVVSFFKMLGHMMTGALQKYISEQGFANSLLHYGAKKTPRISAELMFLSDKGTKDTYSFALSHASRDILIFNEEIISFCREGLEKPFKKEFDAGHKEAKICDDARNSDYKTSKIIYTLLKNCQPFQFHDTSHNSGIRNSTHVSNTGFLRWDGGNLSGFLYELKNSSTHEKYYNRIINRISEMIPFFKDFLNKPRIENPEYIILDWEEKNSEYIFGPHQLSDGSLRYMALCTLLLQPPEKMPGVIVIDEPELGLHPAAISSLAGMVKIASKHTQIVLATQSPLLIDEFEAHNIIVAERNEQTGGSEFKRLNEDELSNWLKDYTISELWNKNVIGGRP